MSGFTTDELLYPLTKGEAVGHPFRGNQWTTVGGITPEVANFITDKANAFYKAGGTIEHLKPGATKLSNGRTLASEKDRLKQEVAPIGAKLFTPEWIPKELPEKERQPLARLHEGYGTNITNLALAPTSKSSLLVALDKDGNVVGTLDYTQGEQTRVGMLGSTNSTSGIATALEVEVARLAAKNDTPVWSEATSDSENFHALMGRTLTPRGTDLTASRWTPEEAKAIASLPIGPKHL